MATDPCPTCAADDSVRECPTCGRTPKLVWSDRLSRWVKVGGGATVAMTLMACYGPPSTGWNDAQSNSPVPAADPTRGDPPPATPFDLDAERLGDLKLGLTAGDVVKALGEPHNRGAKLEEGATGLTLQDWTYPEKGVSLSMADGDSGQTVNNITITAPSTLKTTRGIGIGSTRAEVEQAYGANKDASFSDDTQLVAGSVYGGIFFRFEGDRVASIFMGAGAE